MHGNVWEWVEDCWHESYVDAPDDGTAWVTDCDEALGIEADSVRVVRGGSWLNRPDGARSAFRNWYTSVNRDFNLGFRVLCSSPS